MTSDRQAVDDIPDGAGSLTKGLRVLQHLPEARGGGGTIDTGDEPDVAVGVGDQRRAGGRIEDASGVLRDGFDRDDEFGQADRDDGDISSGNGGGTAATGAGAAGAISTGGATGGAVARGSSSAGSGSSGLGVRLFHVRASASEPS